MAYAPAPDAQRPSSPRCVAADPMEVEPQAAARAPAPAERTRPLGALYHFPSVHGRREAAGDGVFHLIEIKNNSGVGLLSLYTKPASGKSQHNATARGRPSTNY